MWDKCGMARNAEGLKQAITEIQQLKKEFWSDVRIPGEINEMNPELDKAGRVADFIELGELMCLDALNRNESCGVISGKKAKRRKEKQIERMKNFLTCHHGNSKEKIKGVA
jgi:succinate dehydrogenase/fumarate reductase flavoprotein subunit